MEHPFAILLWRFKGDRHQWAVFWPRGASPLWGGLFTHCTRTKVVDEFLANMLKFHVVSDY